MWESASEAEDMVRRLLESHRSAQEVSAHLYISCPQELGWYAPQAQLLAVLFGEFANPLSKGLGAMCKGYQGRETHLTGKEGWNRGT